MKDNEERERQEGLMDRSDGVVAAEEERNGKDRSQHGLLIGHHRLILGRFRWGSVRLGAILDSSENASHIASPMAFVMQCVKHFNGSSIGEDRRTIPQPPWEQFPLR